MKSELQRRALAAWEILQTTYDSDSSMLNYADAWQLLVAVVLSAQTTDAQVNRMTPELFRQWPNPAALASANLPDIERAVRSSGYYRQKAKHIKAASALLVERFGGRVPSSMNELLELPGVGRKSAGVILHHIYNKPAIIVDTHFGRVVSRLGLLVGVGLDPSDKKPDPLLVEQVIAELLPSRYWSEFSMTANLHGRQRCHARKPDCQACELAALCAYTNSSSVYQT